MDERTRKNLYPSSPEAPVDQEGALDFSKLYPPRVNEKTSSAPRDYSSSVPVRSPVLRPIEDLFGTYNNVFVEFEKELRDRKIDYRADRLQKLLQDLHLHGSRDPKDRTGAKRLDFFANTNDYNGLKEILVDASNPLNYLGSADSDRRTAMADAKSRLERIYALYLEENKKTPSQDHSQGSSFII
jgi:hypothetical protein